ncbi:MAG: hypothetical protein LBJ17_05410 [Dysgonamonadaceae bacterium]|jgi:hypothetical protein|nr:hypothetical protein [Dysgonamonadaceae bacterium]
MEKKSLFNKLKDSGIFVFLLLMLCSIVGVVDAGAMYADTLGIGAPDQLYGEDGVAVEGEISLTDAMANASEVVSKHYLKDVIDTDPYGSPAMMAMLTNHHFKKREKTNDHIIQINEVSTKPIQITVITDVPQYGTDGSSSSPKAQCAVDFGSQANAYIYLHQTIIFKGVDGYEPDGITKSGHYFIARVVARDGNGAPVLKPVNGQKTAGVYSFPAIAAGVNALRGARIGTESQLRTENFGLFPSPTEYFVSKQIIQMATTGWYDNATKNIRWGDEEIKRKSITEKLRTFAPLFWLGQQGAMLFPEYISNEPEMAYFGEGIFYQCGRDINLGGSVDINTIVSLYNVAFGNNNSGNTKIFAMGSEIFPLFQKVILNNTGLNVGNYNNGKLNVDFTQISFAGKNIAFIADPSLDDCGLADQGVLIDPKYAMVYSYPNTFLPITKENQGRDVTGISIVDESAYILANKNAHVYVTL